MISRLVLVQGAWPARDAAWQALRFTLVDRVLPTVAVRQYVLAFPYELLGLAATRPEVLAALSRIFWELLLGRYRVWAKAAGYAPRRWRRAR